MKVAVFKYYASMQGSKGYSSNYGECIDSELIQSELNEFMEDKEVIDIKTNTFTSYRHNNGGYDEVFIVYTIMYNEKQEELND
jgi:hypothetical protein